MYLIPTETLEKLINFLAQKHTYAEVALAIEELKSLKQADTKEKQ